MKQSFSASALPAKAILLTGSSHEDRCTKVTAHLGDWRPVEAVIFRYSDPNPRREANLRTIQNNLRKVSVYTTLVGFTESDAARSLHGNMITLVQLLRGHRDAAVVLDISVLTKRHLLMLLRWIDDEGFWDRLCLLYSEPEDYDISEFIPLSFGLSSFQHIPGFAACPDVSRPVHLVLFLGYEGDRALAVYDRVQPLLTSLIVPDPPYRPSWYGRTEKANAGLIAVVGEERISKADSVDPEATCALLAQILGDPASSGQYANVVCPLGTKPQTVGVYEYVRDCRDQPAVVYASPLRHNHDFGSHGAGATWILKLAK